MCKFISRHLRRWVGSEWFYKADLKLFQLSKIYNCYISETKALAIAIRTIAIAIAIVDKKAIEYCNMQ